MKVARTQFFALSARGEVFRVAPGGQMTRTQSPLSSVEREIQGLSRIEYFHRPFVAMLAVAGNQVLAQKRMHPNTFYPLSPLDYGKAVSQFVEGKTVVPLQIFTTLSDRCNFACRLCFSRPEREAGQPNDLSAETYIETLRFLLRFGGPLAQNVSSGGSGEAILHPDFTNILDFSGEHGVMTFLTTNGSRVDQSFAESVARSASIVTFSIHGIHEEAFRGLENPPSHITLDRIMRSIELVASLREKYGRSRELIIGVLSLVHPANTGHYAEFVARLVDFGVDYVHFNPVLPSLAAHGISFSADERQQAEGEFAQLPGLFARAGTFIRVPDEVYGEQREFYFDPRQRMNPDTCLISLLQPSIHPIYGDPGRAKVSACRFYPDVTNDPAFWYTGELGPRSFESVWTDANIARIQTQAQKCQRCSSERQLMALDWMLYIKRKMPLAEFYLLFPADKSQDSVLGFLETI